MNAQDLKNSILQLAVQGKLVEQRPEEGTARELIKRIKAEKEKLIKEKKIKKEKPLPEITEDEIPFEIPESWEWVRLDDVLEIARGASPRPIKDFITNEEDGVNWIKIGDTDKGGKYINSTAEKITLAGKEKSRYVQRGSFLLSNSMSFGRPYILNIDGCIHDGWLVLNQRVNVFEQDYLYYVLSSKMVYYQFCNKVSGAVVKVRETIVPIPPLDEQKRIVAKIEEILPYIDQYDKAYTKLEIFNKKFPEDMKKSILQLAMQGKLVEQRAEEGTGDELYKQIVAEKSQLIKDGKIKKEKSLPEITEDEIPFEIPSSWKWVRLGTIASVYGGKRIPAGTRLSEEDTGHKYIRVADMKDGTVSLEDIKYITDEIFQKIKQYYITSDDIYITVAGTIGKVGIVPDELNNANLTENADKLVFSNLDKMFLCRTLNSEVIQHQIREATTQVGQPKLARIQKLLIPLPPLAEQKRIVAKIEELLPYCDQLVK